jgi:hypothetical protein
MPVRARILLVGTLIATAASAGVATSQSAPDPTTVESEQVQLGDVFATQTLNVVDVTGPTTVTTAAVGNSLSGAVDGASLELTSSQAMAGSAAASTTITGSGSLGSTVTVVTEAVGNGGEAAAYNGNMTANVTQGVTGGQITADTTIDAASGRITCCASVSTTALANSQAYGVVGGTATTSTTQFNTAIVQSQTGAVVQYMPAPAVFSSSSIANNVSSSGENATQSATVVQSVTGQRTQASTFVSTGNAWDVTAAATATANNAAIVNQGGSLAATTSQDNTSYVRSESVVNAYDYGAATAMSFGVGNSVLAGENGGYVDIDNTQLNSGGVEVVSTFTGQTGYDAYGSAIAQGNAITGYACSECEATLRAASRQTNDSDVSATTTMTVNGSGRAAVGNANAVGNSATFYVTRPGN